MLDVPLRPVARRVEECPMVPLRQVPGQQAHGGEIHRTVGQQSQDRGKPPRRAGGFDPAVGGVFRQVQHLHAIGKQRGTPFTQIQPAHVELRERGDELRRRRTLAYREARHFREQH
jgi:hypothetical protein